MIIYRYCVLMLVLIASFSSGATTAFAQKNLRYHHASNQLAEISQQQAVAIAQQHVPGRLLSVQRTTESYRVKILSHKGTVHVVTIDSRSGAVIATH
ncbi:PepSY domain-containing protein [Nitrosomonas sp.]|jgi:uncharacterized membrane protein YkoI|nr:PepSY domain-containing protein [Nitrosomonas sp.]